MDATKNERRIAQNGKAYTYEEFAAYYDSQILLAMWQEAEVLHSAEQPANTDGSSIPEGQDAGLSREEPAAAAGPVDTIAGEPEDSDEQPVSIVCLTNCDVQDVRLSWAQLARIKREKNCGGQPANAEQIRLRQHCLANDLLEIDLTDSTYEWKQLLKAMPEGKSRPLVGAGVVKFSFRLLQNARDHNYFKIDSGEKHVFEIMCVDGLRWQLHFHKNGSMDNPVQIPLRCSMPHPMLRDQFMNDPIGSAVRPAHEENSVCHLEDIYSSTIQESVPVGRAEVRMALTTILQNHFSQEIPFAVNITAISAFPWHRWLRNVFTNGGFVCPGIVKVFALCDTSIQDPQIVFCHPNDTYTRVRPGERLEYKRFNGWTEYSTFLLAPVETVSWMRSRAQQS